MVTTPIEVLGMALRSMWGTNSARTQTLARLVRHERQIEAWWKCEIAAHMWDHVEHFDERARVWIEAHGRADLTVALGDKRPVTSGDSVLIPIELKTIGTFWGRGRGNVAKAYGETGKKRLEHDLRDASSGRRLARPFAAVGLLVTHVGAQADDVYERYLSGARELGAKHNLVRVLDEAIELPPPRDASEPASLAHQFLWVSPGRAVGA